MLAPAADLRIGTRIVLGRARTLHAALRDAGQTIDRVHSPDGTHWPRCASEPGAPDRSGSDPVERDVIGVDNMMCSDYPHSESTFPQSRKILAEILAGVPDDEQAKIAGGNTARVYNFDVARLTVPA